MNQQILIDHTDPSTANILVESNDQQKQAWINGIFMQSGVKNRNGRVYPIQEISSAVSNANDTIKKTNGIFGELDHPQTLTINLDRISHVITEMRMQGHNAVGRAKILNTPMGQIAKELLNSGVSFGVSSRGAGNVSESGDVSSFQFVTVDLVASPSAPEAYPSTVYESLQQYKNGHNIMDLAESIKHDSNAQKYLKSEIVNWLKTGIFLKK